MQNALGLFSFPDLDLLVFLIRLNSVMCKRAGELFKFSFLFLNYG